jgi:hypothetical protein
MRALRFTLIRIRRAGKRPGPRPGPCCPELYRRAAQHPFKRFYLPLKLPVIPASCRAARSGCISAENRPRTRLPEPRCFYAAMPDTSPTLSLGQLQKTEPGWVWLYCLACNHSQAVAIAPFVIRWGPNTSSDKLRRSARCSRCHGQGATIRHASWGDMATGWQPFPAAAQPRIARIR